MTLSMAAEAARSVGTLRCDVVPLEAVETATNQICWDGTPGRWGWWRWCWRPVDPPPFTATCYKPPPLIRIQWGCWIWQASRRTAPCLRHEARWSWRRHVDHLGEATTRSSALRLRSFWGGATSIYIGFLLQLGLTFHFLQFSATSGSTLRGEWKGAALGLSVEVTVGVGAGGEEAPTPGWSPAVMGLAGDGGGVGEGGCMLRSEPFYFRD